jgi:hypothetical protein
MAWLEVKSSGIYYIGFRVGDEKFKKSLKTKNEKDAEARRNRVEENIRLVESGRLTIPVNSDIAVFLLSDGKLNASLKTPKSIRLGQLFRAYSVPICVLMKRQTPLLACVTNLA